MTSDGVAFIDAEIENQAIYEKSRASRTIARFSYLLKRDKIAIVSFVILSVFIICALIPSRIAPYDPYKMNLRSRFEPPMGEGVKGSYILGTDQLGRDLLSRIIYGARVSLVVSSSAVLLSLILGVTIGLISGFVGGLGDNALMGLTEVQLAIPYILLAIAIIAILGPSNLNLIIVCAVTGWTVYAKLVRAQVLSVREETYVMAAKAIGCTVPQIIFNHILPQIIVPIIVVATLEMARIILLEASLSFLGLGVQPPNISWGLILSDGREYLNSAWWVSTFSGIAIMLTVLAINSIGNLLSEVLDPRRQEG